MISFCLAYERFPLISPISCPWNYQGSICGKVAAWAAFFFIGWTFHIPKVISRGYEILINRGKVHSIGNNTLSNNVISKGLAAFDSADVNGIVNGIYMTTNETDLAVTRQLLREHPRPSRETIHIGCAAWHNLDIICERKSSYGLIFDFNPENANFIRKTIEIIAASDSREAFKQGIANYLNSLEGVQRKLFFHWDQLETPPERVVRELSREGSWLHSEETYRYIKSLVSNNRLVAINEDITNVEKFSEVRKFLDRNGIAIDTLYLSNICNFMKTSANKNAFMESVKRLVNRDSIFINCPTRRQKNTNDVILLKQKAILGREILSGSFDPAKLFEEIIP